MSVLRVLPWALVVTLWLFSFAVYGGLPDRIPTGINADGAARGWREKSWALWMMLPLLALVIQGFTSWLSAVLPRRPHLFNFPDKEQLLRLPEEYRPRVYAAMRNTLDLIMTLTNALLFYVHFLMWQTAMGRGSSDGVLAVLLFGFAIGPVALISVTKVSTEVEEAEKRWKANERNANG